MTANELRIGNYLSDLAGGQFKVRGTTSRGVWVSDSAGPASITNFNPIPITEEWLLKFGFRKQTEKTFIKGHMDYSYVLTHRSQGGFNNGGYWIGIRYDDWFTDPNTVYNFGYGVIGLQYVHHLQNLYFFLTGEEL